MFAHGQTVIQMMERLAPKSLAEDWDKVGLQVGTLQKEVKKVLVTLEVTEAVAEEAVREQADLIIAHHPLIFRPLQHLITDYSQGRKLELLIKHDIAVYASHTNLDITDGGMNDWMAEALQLNAVSPMQEQDAEKLYKLVVFVPVDHHERVLQAIFEAGAGWIGNYSHCSFNIEGTGTFLPQEGTDPYIGQAGKLERVQEIRIETIVPERVRKLVVQAMLKAHPYEEVAYDLYELTARGKTRGLGRVGTLAESVTLEAFAEQVKQALNVKHVRVVGPLDRMVKKIAVLGGSGSKYVRDAIRAGADVYVSGDIDYHTAQDALADGICIVDPGHHAEVLMKDKVAEYLQQQLAEAGYATEVLVSTVPTDPFTLR
jgi:dinuclear metal center YbgI/SA1388 family protein